MMKNESSFIVAKQIFFAWKRFKQAFTYGTEFNLSWYSYNPYRLNLKAVHSTLLKAIGSSSLSENLKAVARDLLCKHRYTKKKLITEGRATATDFDKIRSVLAATISYYTHSEQEKRYLADFFKKRFDHPAQAPYIILNTPLSYDALSALLDNQDVLTDDEEAILALFLLGEISDDELTITQRFIFLDAVRKLEIVFRYSEAEFYKHLVKLYIAAFPNLSLSQLCETFNLNKARVRGFCRYYLQPIINEKKRRQHNFLDE